MKIKVRDSTINFDKYKKYYNHNIVVPKHKLVLEVSDIPSTIIAAFRFILIKYLYTKRFLVDIENIETDDINVIKEDIIHRFSSLFLSDDIPETEFELNVINTNKDNSYVVVSTNAIKLKDGNINKYCNYTELFGLGMNKQIAISGKIQKDTGINHSVYYDKIYLFKRDLEEVEKDELIYQSGTITIHYTNTTPGDQLIKESFNILVDMISDLHKNIETRLEKTINIYIITIQNDRSTCIASLIESYIYQFSNYKFKINIREIENYNSILEFSSVDKKYLLQILDKALTKLESDLKKIL